MDEEAEKERGIEKEVEEETGEWMRRRKMRGKGRKEGNGRTSGSV